MTDNSGARHGNKDEQFMILQMVQDGTISPDEGGRLMEAMARAADRAKSLREDFTREMGMEITEVAEFELALAHLRVPETV